jgi:phage/plasmid-like protein (TIGR03299 family)
MAHLIETMAYTNQVPWHGLGNRVEKNATIEEMIQAAGLDWRVDAMPLYYRGPATDDNDPDPRDMVKDFSVLVRSSDRKVLDVVGSRYIPTQNHEALGFFKEFVEAGGATMETAGSLKDGRMVWGLANLNSSFKLKNDDEVKGYLLVGCPHEQGKSLVIKFTTIRVVCNNTLTLALRKDSGIEFRMNHRNSFDNAMISKAKDTLGIARDQLGDFERNARILQSINISRDDAVRILAPVYQDDVEKPETLISDPGKMNTRMRRVMDVLSRAPGAEPETAWGVLNAVTYYSDHVAGRLIDQRLSNAWLGKTARQKEMVLDKLLTMA